MRSSLFVASVCTLLLTACSGGLSDDDSRVAWAATQVALSQGQTQAQLAASGTPLMTGDEVAFRRGGGLLHRRRHGALCRDRVGGERRAGAVNFTLATTFDGCDVSGITISGDLDYVAEVTTSGTSATSALTMHGSLSYEGKVEGSCDWDLTMKVAATATGGGGGSASAEFSGSICGHDASATLKVG
ncbi:MAG: hypothetical protein IPO88_29610 [Nannocystis sp.]|uniref:hypothetical protein n=1 Tax=Nannocystis sp. TaxID=1962667 RepID=UPI0024255AE5|nr:hypothetical protein [Nannocystis sp.]MBK9757589.1 hypothetical protein [Nannocystis sp.]